MSAISLLCTIGVRRRRDQVGPTELLADCIDLHRCAGNDLWISATRAFRLNKSFLMPIRRRFGQAIGRALAMDWLVTHKVSRIYVERALRKFASLLLLPYLAHPVAIRDLAYDLFFRLRIPPT